MVSNINNRKVAPNNVNDDLFNEKIPFREVLVINADGEQLGVMSKKRSIGHCIQTKFRFVVCSTQGASGRV